MSGTKNNAKVFQNIPGPSWADKKKRSVFLEEAQEKGDRLVTEQQKAYRGWRNCEWPHLTHVLVNDQPLCHVHEHSSEMTWGYSGSGPADLALSILTDYLGGEERAFQLHQQFKRRFVAGFDETSWTLDSGQINTWLQQPTS